MKITSAEICAFLRKKHVKDIWAEELRLSSGFGREGRIDFWAINVGPSTGNRAVAYEVKISKADFKRDTNDKQRGARLICDAFYYIAPAGIIPKDNVPDWAGLIELVPGRYGLKEEVIITAPKRDKDGPSWGLVCSLLRNAKRHGGSL